MNALYFHSEMNVFFEKSYLFGMKINNFLPIEDFDKSETSVAKVMVARNVCCSLSVFVTIFVEKCSKL